VSPRFNTHFAVKNSGISSSHDRVSHILRPVV